MSSGATPTSGRTRPQIVENYHDFVPPAWLRTVIEDALNSVPQKYLAGLKTVVLANKTALTRDQRRQKIWSRKKKYQFADARGAYYAATRSRPASVWLFADNILRSLPAWYFRMPIFAVAEFAEVLFHEIGHHIHAVHKPVYDGKENVAEDWSGKLWGRFARRRYWYAMPVLFPIAMGIKFGRRVKKGASASRKSAQRG